MSVRKVTAALLGNWFNTFPSSTEAAQKVNVDAIVLPHATEKWKVIEEHLRPEIKTFEQLSEATANIHNTPMQLMALQRVLDRHSEESKTFFHYTLPFIQNLVLKIPETFKEKELKILKMDHPGMLRLSCRQCACLNAAAFFNLLPHGEMCLELSFAFILNKQPEKVKCLLHYFRRLRTSLPDRYVEIHRNVLPETKLTVFSAAALLNNETPLAKFEVKGRPHTIEDAEGCMQADFANEWIGGGVLRAGCVQEEILFMEKPECLIALLVCNVVHYPLPNTSSSSVARTTV